MTDGLRTFDAKRIERDLSPLERLGRGLWLPAIINTEGRLVDRLDGLAWLRESLVRGEAPWDGGQGRTGGEGSQVGPGWPSPDVRACFNPVIARLKLEHLCEGQPDTTEQVLRSLLWYFDQITGLSARLGRQEALSQLASRFHDDWDAHRRDLEEVLRVLESLDGVAHFARSSALRGLLKTEAWQSLLQAHELIASMPGLRALVRSLGRARPSDPIEEQRESQQSAESTERQWATCWHERRMPGVASEVEGVRRAGDIHRLIASELTQWRRQLPSDPQRMRRLRRLFAARLSEQSLLSLEHHERVREWQRVEQAGLPERDESSPQARREAGPIILCLDTSASMAGGPERVAKAIALEAMRTAAREGRGCHLLAFSGPGELRDTCLSMDAEGLAELAQFVAAGFHGGTDIVEPIEAALQRIALSEWRQADILIASDGEFGVTPATYDSIIRAKAELGLRVQGVLIGDRETIGLREICDSVFWVRDWRRYGGEYGQTDSPVHDKSLTQLYFPSASMRPPG